MLNYIIRRLFLIVPTLVGIVIINFLIIQGAPGGPVEQTLAKIQGTDVEATARVSGSSQGETVPGLAQPGPSQVGRATEDPKGASCNRRLRRATEQWAEPNPQPEKYPCRGSNPGPPA